MKSFISKEVVSHPYVLGALAVVVVIAAGSGAYYLHATQVPGMVATQADSTSTVLATGVVEPAQSGDLSFVSGGRVVRVPNTVGAHVVKGQVLASLDTAALAANAAQAAAGLKSAQAKLAELQAPTRSVDLQQKQTAVSQADITLANAYTNAPTVLGDVFSKAYGAIHSTTDTLLSNPDSISPTIVFQTTASQAAQDAQNARVAVTDTLKALQAESLSPGTSQADIESTLSKAATQVLALRSFGIAMSQALTGAVATGNFTAAQATAAQTNVGGMQTTLNTLASTLQTTLQTIQSDKLAVQSAQDALDQASAGATTETIQAQEAAVESAQASLSAAQAALNNSVVVAPFSGSVASVHVKNGDVVAPGTLAVSITPDAALQISAYYSEIDVAHIAVGQSAQVTLDAYGSARVFPATVVSVDRAPTMQGNTPAYKVVLQFASADPDIAIGMSANVTIQNN